MKKRCLWVFVLCLLAFLVIGDTKITLAQQQNDKLDKVTLRMSWIPLVDYAMYVVGLKKGFYRQEGIDLVINWAQGSALSTKLIATREDTFGSASIETVIIARTKGMPLKVLATFHQKTPVSIFSLKKVPLKSPKDLEGKSIASDINTFKHTQFQVFCKINNVDIDKIKIIPIKGSDFVHLLQGTADTMLAYGYLGHTALRKKGIEFNEINLSDYGIDVLGISIITHEDLIKENPSLVRRFIRATLKSWNYAVNHPEEAVDALIEAYPDLNKEEALYQIPTLIWLMQDDNTKKYGLGYQSKERWQKTQDLLYDQGLIDKKINVEEAYTNNFMPK